MIIILVGVLGAAIGAVVAEYTVGLAYTTYSVADRTVQTHYNEEAITYVVIGLAVGIVIGCLMELVLINEENIENAQASSNADEIRKLKILLDNGTITQEEFDEKKKQLLNI